MGQVNIKRHFVPEFGSSPSVLIMGFDGLQHVAVKSADIIIRSLGMEKYLTVTFPMVGSSVIVDTDGLISFLKIEVYYKKITANKESLNLFVMISRTKPEDISDKRHIAEGLVDRVIKEEYFGNLITVISLGAIMDENISRSSRKIFITGMDKEEIDRIIEYYGGRTRIEKPAPGTRLKGLGAYVAVLLGEGFKGKILLIYVITLPLPLFESDPESTRTITEFVGKFLGFRSYLDFGMLEKEITVLKDSLTDIQKNISSFPRKKKIMKDNRIKTDEDFFI